MANISFFQRIIRVILGLLLTVYGLGVEEKTLWTYVLILIGIVFFIEGLIGWCGFHALFSNKETKRLHRITKEDLQKAVQEHMSMAHDIKSEVKKGKSSTTKTTTKKSTTAKKTASKKASPKKSTPKTAASKKATAKKTASKTSAKKTTGTKKSTAKKSTTKKK
jgi:cytoskeletal protein RodZ